MRKKIWFASVIFITLLIVLALDSKYRYSLGERNTIVRKLNQAIYAVEAFSILDVPLEIKLRGNDKTIWLVQNVETLKMYIRPALLDAELSFKKKSLVIKVSQCLSPEEYLDLFSFLVEAAIDGRVHRELPLFAMYSEAAWGDGLSFRYGEERVMENVVKLRKLFDDDPDILETIDEMVMGRAAEYLDHLERDTNERGPVIPCQAADQRPSP